MFQESGGHVTFEYGGHVIKTHKWGKKEIQDIGPQSVCSV